MINRINAISYYMKFRKGRSWKRNGCFYIKLNWRASIKRSVVPIHGSQTSSISVISGNVVDIQILGPHQICLVITPGPAIRGLTLPCQVILAYVKSWEPQLRSCERVWMGENRTGIQIWESSVRSSSLKPQLENSTEWRRWATWWKRSSLFQLYRVLYIAFFILPLGTYDF